MTPGEGPNRFNLAFRQGVTNAAQVVVGRTIPAPT